MKKFGKCETQVPKYAWGSPPENSFHCRTVAQLTLLDYKMDLDYTYVFVQGSVLTLDN